MVWVVETLDATVDAELEALPADQIAKFLRIGELIQALGLERIREPHVKHLEGPLWEIRMKGRDGISRPLCGGKAEAGGCGPGVCQEDPEDPTPGN